jgi:hypothetical protein
MTGMTERTLLPIGSTVGFWIVLSIDVSGRRAACQCRCGAVREVSVDALVSGASTSCGCAPLSSLQLEKLRDSKSERQRRRGRDWRPGERWS